MNPVFCGMSAKPMPEKPVTVGEVDYHYGKRDELAKWLETLYTMHPGDWKIIASFVQKRMGT